MKDELDANDLFNSLMMGGSGRSGPVVVVEGESDYNLLREHLGPEIDLEIGFGKQNLIGLARLLLNEPVRKIAVLVDADFDRILGADPYPDNVFASRAYDVWVDVHSIKPAILRRVVRSSLKDVVRNDVAKAVVEVAEFAAARVGAVRYFSVANSLGLDTSKFPMQEIVGLEEPRATERVVEIAGRRVGKSHEEIKEIVDGVMACGDLPSDEFLMNGHDLLDGAKQVLRVRKVGQLVDAEFAYCIAIDRESFQQVDVFRDLELWADLEAAA